MMTLMIFINPNTIDMTYLEACKKFNKIFGIKFPMDILTSKPGNVKVDIIELDRLLAQKDPEYDPEECAFQGRKNISLSDYIEMKYGAEAKEMIADMILPSHLAL